MFGSLLIRLVYDFLYFLWVLVVFIGSDAASSSGGSDLLSYGVSIKMESSEFQFVPMSTLVSNSPYCKIIN